MNRFIPPEAIKAFEPLLWLLSKQVVAFAVIIAFEVFYRVEAQASAYFAVSIWTLLMVGYIYFRTIKAVIDRFTGGGGGSFRLSKLGKLLHVQRMKGATVKA